MTSKGALSENVTDDVAKITRKKRKREGNKQEKRRKME